MSDKKAEIVAETRLADELASLIIESIKLGECEYNDKNRSVKISNNLFVHFFRTSRVVTMSWFRPSSDSFKITIKDREAAEYIHDFSEKCISGNVTKLNKPKSAIRNFKLKARLRIAGKELQERRREYDNALLREEIANNDEEERTTQDGQGARWWSF